MPLSVVAVFDDPIVTVPPDDCVVAIETSPTPKAAPITMFPFTALGPIAKEVFPADASVTQSIIGVVNFVVALTLVPLRTVEDDVLPMVITLAVEDPVPMLMADVLNLEPVPRFRFPSVCADPRFILPV